MEHVVFALNIVGNAMAIRRNAIHARLVHISIPERSCVIDALKTALCVITKTQLIASNVNTVPSTSMIVVLSVDTCVTDVMPIWNVYLVHIIIALLLMARVSSARTKIIVTSAVVMIPSVVWSVIYSVLSTPKVDASKVWSSIVKYLMAIVPSIASNVSRDMVRVVVSLL